MKYLKMRKTNFKIWKRGVHIGPYLITWWSPLRLRKRIESASVLSKSWDFFPR